MLANYKRSAGDYMGTAGNLNDDACPTAPVRTYLPNDFGLYHMGGNVSEWTADLYRPLTSITLRDVENHDLNPYRGGKFQQKKLDENGQPIEKDSMGRLQYEPVKDDQLVNRENYKRGEVHNYLDGDQESSAYYDSSATLINDETRVIKGGSWADRAFFLSPGTRRYKEEDRADRSIGFRCAMIRVGSPSGNDNPGGNEFKTKGRGKKKDKRRF